MRKSGYMGDIKNIDEITADLWIPQLVKDLENGRRVKLSPNGGSMLPFIVGGRDDAVLVKPQRLKRGDVVLYRRKNGKYVLHRIHHIEEEKFYLIGDSQVDLEGPLEREQILGVADEFVRKGRQFSKGNVGYQIWWRIWLWVRPFRPKLIHFWWGFYRIFGKDCFK